MVSFTEIKEWDYNLSKRISSILSYDGMTRKFLHFFTLTGTAPAWWVGLIIWYFVTPKFHVEAYSMFAVNTIMTIAVLGVKVLVKRPRPDFKDERVTISFDVFSFPSGHATRSAYVAILMSIYVPELTLVWYIWGIIMIISRLVLGVHYVTDIIIGTLFGCLSVLIMWLLGLLPYFPLSDLFA